MRKLLRLFVASLLLLPIIGVQPVFAGTQGSCSPSDNEKVIFYENAIGDTSDGDDRVFECGTGRADMSALSHTLPGYCHSGNPLKNEWEDCASSMFPYIPSGKYLCLYGNKSYSHQNVYYTFDHGDSGTRQNIFSDGMSSWKFVTLPAAC